MTRTLMLAAAAIVAVAAIAAPAEARWHRWGPPLGFAFVAPPPVYVGAPVYVGPHCYVRRERIWNGFTWRFRRVEECD